MNREIKMILMDRAERYGLELSLLWVCLSWIGGLVLGDNADLLGIVAALTGLLLATTAYDYGAVQRVYTQLPIRAADAGRSGICSILAFAALIFLPMAPIAKVGWHSLFPFGDGPAFWKLLSLTLCAGAAAVSMACLFLLIRVALQQKGRLQFAFIPHRFRGLAMETTLDAWIWGPFIVGGLMLWAVGEPGWTETILLMALAGILSIWAWHDVPRTRHLSIRSSGPSRPVAATKIRLEPAPLAASPRWAAARHFWLLSSLLLLASLPLIVLDSSVRSERLQSALRIGDPELIDYARISYFPGMIMFPIYLMWMLPQGKGTPFRVYRSLPMTAGQLTWRFGAMSAIGAGAALLASVAYWGAGPDAWIPVIGACLGFSSGAFLFIARAGSLRDWNVFLASALIVGSLITGFTAFRLGPDHILTAPCMLVEIAIAFYAPFYVRYSLIESSEIYRKRGSDYA